MIAWHDAVTINTVASYQSFLAGYGSSDFAVTANRLVDRLRTRSVFNALSAFAAAGPTCPCNNQPAPTAPRHRRADVSPSDNPTGSAPAATPTGRARAPTSSGPGARVFSTDPLPPPAVVVTPPYIHPPRGHDKPRGGDKPTGDKPGGDKPTGSSSDKPTGSNGDGRGYGKDKNRGGKGRGPHPRGRRLKAAPPKMGPTQSRG